MKDAKTNDRTARFFQDPVSREGFVDSAHSRFDACLTLAETVYCIGELGFPGRAKQPCMPPEFFRRFVRNLAANRADYERLDAAFAAVKAEFDRG